MQHLIDLTFLLSSIISFNYKPYGEVLKCNKSFKQTLNKNDFDFHFN